VFGASRPRLSLFVLVLGAALVGGVTPASASTAGRFVADANNARARYGLRSYAVAGDLTAVAQRWAQWMASHRTLAHNPSLASAVCCWRDLGENVGSGSSEWSIQSAFMASPEHRANILSSSYTQIGVGTAVGSDGKLYADEVFRRPMRASSTSGASSTSPTWSIARSTSSAQPASRSMTRASDSSQSPAVVLRPDLVAWRKRDKQVRRVDPVGRSLVFVRAMLALST